MSSALVTQEQPKPQERNLSWGEVDWWIEKAIISMRQARYYPKRILPIGGGGIIPAGIIAYRLYKKEHIPVELLNPVYAKSYDRDNKQQLLTILWPADIDLYNNRDTLVVDDIVDTGATWKAVQKELPKAVFFALVTKINGQPHFWSLQEDPRVWTNFPWEKVPQQSSTK